MAEIRIHKTAERPSIELWWQAADGSLIDFTTGYTFTFKVGDPSSAAIFTKTSGITGAAGSGTQQSGTPNITITFTAGELDSVDTSRKYTWQLRATTGGLDRIFEGEIRFLPVIT